jgi:hypothetical protein
MFQPRVKLEFVRRYCTPCNGWQVCVDIDASETGNTGGERKTRESQERQKAMLADAPRVKAALQSLDVSVGDRSGWCHSRELPYLEGDPDVTAYDAHKKRCIIAEVEGASSGQPEQKLYKAIGQMVRTVSNLPPGWNSHLVIVVYGDKIADHLQRAHALAKLGISGLALVDDARKDRWLFGEPLRLYGR